MLSKDPRVDAYIAKANDFARPILARIRTAVHKGHRGVSETIKWGVPAYVDDRGILCLTPAFKRHCAWVFWTGRKPTSVDPKSLRRIESAKELPSAAIMTAAVREAATAKASNKRPAPRRSAPRAKR